MLRALTLWTTLAAGATGVALGQFAFSRLDLPAEFSSSLYAADFDGDRRPDLLLSTVEGGRMLYLHGRGNGTFDPARTIDAFTNLPVSSRATADLNGDGRSDIAAIVGFPSYDPGAIQGHVRVVLSQGNGLFSQARPFPAGPLPFAIVIADFTGDGKPDLAVGSRQVTIGGSTAINLLGGKGNGDFGLPIESLVPSGQPYLLATGDFNGDGKTDLLVEHYPRPSTWLLLSRGDGTFEAGRSVPLSGGILYTGFQAADFDHDGKTDLAASSPSQITVLFGAGNGAFRPGGEYNVPGAGTTLAAADLDQDGAPDLATSGQSTVIAMANFGDGTFEAPERIADSSGGALAAADFNQDGKRDLAVPTFSGLTMLLNTVTRPATSPGGIFNAASYQGGARAVAPGEIITIFGARLGPERLATARLQAPDLLDNLLDGVRVLFDGVAAPLLFVSADQLGVVAPYALRERTLLRVEYHGVASRPVRLDVVPSSPGVFTTNAAGFGQAAAFNQDLSPNSPGNPAARGTIITFFATGEGETTPPGVDGRIMPRGDSPLTLPMPALPVIVGVANRGAEVLYAGAVPGQVAGLLQINARIPDDAPTGPGVPLLIKAGDAFSQPGVTLAIR